MYISQSGRSMVEMLGVLAIVGILTVGGMSGYKTAMKRFRANNVLEVISSASLEAQRLNKTVGLAALDDVPESALVCIGSLTAYSGGQVVVGFKSDASCTDEPAMMGASIGRCKWIKEADRVYRYIPDRGSAPQNEETGTGPCYCDEFHRNEDGSKVSRAPC